MRPEAGGRTYAALCGYTGYRQSLVIALLSLIARRKTGHSAVNPRTGTGRAGTDLGSLVCRPAVGRYAWRQPESANEALKHKFLEYSELLLFYGGNRLLHLMRSKQRPAVRCVARVAGAARVRAISASVAITGCWPFFISPIADNLTNCFC